MNEYHLNQTMQNATFTYSFSKYSCVRSFFFAHVFFCYIVFLSGISCFLTRLHPKVMPAHFWLGRIYIISMLWAMGTAFLVHNTGLPEAVIWSFLWVLTGLSLGWILINIAQNIMNANAISNISAKIITEGSYFLNNNDLGMLIKSEKGIISANKTFVQRFFALKTAHGLLMFMSWINIMGRIFASNQSGNFDCYTYPYYKMINTREFNGTNTTLTPVPVFDPNADRLPWTKIGIGGWAAALSLGPIAVGCIIGLIYCGIISAMKAKSKSIELQSNQEK